MKLSIAVFAFLLVTSLAAADGMTDTNTTTDSMSTTVDVGEGEVWSCGYFSFFSCTDTDGFVCYGWGNCEALDATPVAYDIDVLPPPPVATPEPSALLLLVTGLPLLLWRRRARIH